MVMTLTTIKTVPGALTGHDKNFQADVVAGEEYLGLAMSKDRSE